MITEADDHPQRLARALVDEIWTEMGRKRITSVRALALAAGMLPQQMAARLKVDPKTKKPVVINVRDLAAIADALDVLPSDLVARAEAAVSDADDTITLMAASETDDDTEVESWQEHP